MNNNLVIFSAIIAVAGISGWYFGNDSSPGTEASIAQMKSVSSDQGITATKTTTTTTASRSIASIKKDVPANSSPYMKTLLNEGAAQEVYTRSKKIFKYLPQGEALAKWIALGLRMDSSKEFGAEFQASLATINQNPEEVLEAINGAYAKLGNDDAFIQSMLVNVVHQLNVPKEEKVNFYTERMGDKFTLDSSGEPTASALNITNSMAFLKQYSSDSQNVKSKIETSLSEHRNDKRSQKELAERFAAYFPELKGDIDKWSDQ